MNASVFAYRESFRFIQLQGILHDICKVYMLIYRGGNKVANDENAIRDAVSLYLQNDNYKNAQTDFVRYYQVDTEVREGAHGRTDIRFLKVKEYEGQEVYYTIECKRLDGSNFLFKEYVGNGIRRFTTGKYPSQLGCNAMLGFVVKPIDLVTSVDKVNSYLTATEHLKIQSTMRAPLIRLESQHNAPYGFVLYHLWMDFSTLIK